MAIRTLFSVLCIIFCFSASAQEVRLQQVDKNTYSFSTKEMKLIIDFRIDGPSYHITDDAYSFAIIALTENGEVDKTVNGQFTFIINGETKQISFTDGQAAAEHKLGDENFLKVQLAKTNVEKTKEISRFSGTPKLVGFLLFLLLTFLFRHQLANMFRKLFGSEKK